ncbi:PREDICTED: MOB kinase activator 2-like, partial [Priapulus caudatus]|uniref:MOB kinase activator 2-like n=1 Tax=Priapulus caudatus TaxID=37621 RepID=A0ABM1F4T4_PRICU
MDWFMGKTRRKDKEEKVSSEERKPYLEDALIQGRFCDVDLKKLVTIPQGLDYNEWLATNTISFFQHINLMYGTLSEYCTLTTCPEMRAPQNSQFLWFDDKGKKCKCAAPQYVDYVTTFIQKTINDDSVFPTKYGNQFPTSFE